MDVKLLEELLEKLLRKTLIQYEIYIEGKKGLYHRFESIKEYKLEDKMFFDETGRTACYIVTRITHDFTQQGKKPIVRLTCRFNKYFSYEKQ